MMDQIIELTLAKVAAIVDDYTVVINMGSSDGVRKKQRYLIYGLSADDIKDPDTGESLGKLEIVRGTGIVTHLQEKIATVESDSYTVEEPTRRVVKRGFGGLLSASIGVNEEEILESKGKTLNIFDSPKVGDIAKPI